MTPYCESCGEPMVEYNDRWWCPACRPDDPPPARVVIAPEPEDVSDVACPVCGLEVQRFGDEVICRQRGHHRLKWDNGVWVDGRHTTIGDTVPFDGWAGEDDGGGFSPSSDNRL